MGWLRRHKILVANLALVLVFLAGAGYLLVSIMRINPFEQTYQVRVNMAASGGLQPHNDVTLRGSRVGTVKRIDLTERGVLAVVDIDKAVRIPAGGTVAVQALSAAGEQYIDFRPQSDDAPYLEDGSVVESNQVQTPVPLSTVLDNTSALISQVDPDKFAVILEELDTALGGGPDALKSVIDGVSLTMSGLDSLLPQTTSLIGNLRIIAATTSQIQPDLQTLTNSSGVLFEQFAAADAEVRQFLDLGPGQLATLGGVVNDTADPITNLVTNFVAIAESARLRTNALAALFPSLRDGSLAIGIPAWGNEFHTLVDIYPRPVCDYETIPVSPAHVGDGTTRLWNYCTTDDPTQQVRGSANAPRPDVPNNGATIPPDVDPNQRSTLLPPP